MSVSRSSSSVVSAPPVKLSIRDSIFHVFVRMLVRMYYPPEAVVVADCLLDLTSNGTKITETDLANRLHLSPRLVRSMLNMLRRDHIVIGKHKNDEVKPTNIVRAAKYKHLKMLEKINAKKKNRADIFYTCPTEGCPNYGKALNLMDLLRDHAGKEQDAFNCEFCYQVDPITREEKGPTILQPIETASSFDSSDSSAQATIVRFNKKRGKFDEILSLVDDVLEEELLKREALALENNFMPEEVDAEVKAGKMKLLKDDTTKRISDTLLKIQGKTNNSTSSTSHDNATTAGTSQSNGTTNNDNIKSELLHTHGPTTNLLGLKRDHSDIRIDEMQLSFHSEKKAKTDATHLPSSSLPWTLNATNVTSSSLEELENSKRRLEEQKRLEEDVVSRQQREVAEEKERQDKARQRAAELAAAEAEAEAAAQVAFELLQQRQAEEEAAAAAAANDANANNSGNNNNAEEDDGDLITVMSQGRIIKVKDIKDLAQDDIDAMTEEEFEEYSKIVNPNAGDYGDGEGDEEQYEYY